jgi:O-antigen ligase
MIGYVIVTLLSIAYTSSDPPVNLYLLYDRVVAPMCLYLIVRLLAPDENGLKRLIPAAVFLLVSQSLIGVFSWVSPDALPSEWLGKVGERTTGSLRSTDVFTITVLFCGLFLLHSGLTTRRGSVSRVWAILLFVLAVIMVFVTFSRASWLAGLVAVIGSLYVYRTFLRRLAVIVVPLALLLVFSGLLHQQIEFASYRVDSAESEQTALSRLPVAYAAVRMFEAKPIVGWGYENFNQFDLPFQSRVGDIVYPDKDHSSHNLYLTTLAEQGIVGFVLLLGPACLWFLRWRSRRALLPKTGFLGGKLVATLWLILAAHVVVNNFSRMQVTFGFGMWWLTLGLIATIVDRYRPAADEKTRQTWTVSESRDLARSWQR